MALIYAVGVFTQYLQQRIMIEVSQKALQKIRDELFEKMQSLPVRFFDTHNHGELMSRFTNDVDAVGEMLNNTIVQLFSGTLTVIGTLCMMLYMNITLSIVTIIMVPIFVKVGGRIASRGRKFFVGQQTALGAVNGYIEESVTGQKVVKVFCHEDKCIKEFDKLNNELKDQQIRAQFAGGIMEYLFHLLLLVLHP